jgi:hypothetical protein
VEFGEEFSAVQADSSYPQPPSPDADVASPDVAFPGAEFPPFVSGPGSPGAEGVRLEFHRRSTLRALGFCSRCFFWENKSGRGLVVCNEGYGPLAVAKVEYDGDGDELQPVGSLQ